MSRSALRPDAPRGRRGLHSCPVCALSCVPLTVRGEVIGSVLFNRPARQGSNPPRPPLSLDRALTNEGAVEGVGEVAGEVAGEVPGAV
jgi:hypothetical protein